MSRPNNEWTDLDIRKEIPLPNHTSYRPDIVADAKEIPIRDNYYKEILAHSILEHFGKREHLNYLKEWYRVLKNGGKLVLSVPDVQRVAKKVLSTSHQKQYEAINLLYGEQDFKENTHKWGFTEKSLKATLEQIGFKNFKRLRSKRYPEELFITAIK